MPGRLARRAAGGVAVPAVEVADDATRARRSAPRRRRWCRSRPSASTRCAPSFSYRRRWRALVEQVQVDRAEQRRAAAWHRAGAHRASPAPSPGAIPRSGMPHPVGAVVQLVAELVDAFSSSIDVEQRVDVLAACGGTKRAVAAVCEVGAAGRPAAPRRTRSAPSARGAARPPARDPASDGRERGVARRSRTSAACRPRRAAASA